MIYMRPSNFFFTMLCVSPERFYIIYSHNLADFKRKPYFCDCSYYVEKHHVKDLKWDEVFKNGQSKICGRLPSKNLK